MTTDSAPTGKRREHLARLEQVAREWVEPPIDAPEHTYWVALQVVIELLDEDRRVSPALSAETVQAAERVATMYHVPRSAGWCEAFAAELTTHLRTQAE